MDNSIKISNLLTERATLEDLKTNTYIGMKAHVSIDLELTRVKNTLRELGYNKY